ncbi:MAG: protein-glutamate O-methyltransferase CheR [gamma proteobacterium symbiont of Bathyaustriella thionipta]|nr:protein-glutamate O-methyltransferase CheR [gamma proteobacterium symbiont of Bathyaustriella thionipta]MCU7949660.1 protein-glutamate O-methyltransferase CheR [gamma proteobacterium symbiont of Bathyaustriella thionipta]MCU7954396.1 protein-glutamate O-methyltransferase CheR [gamma proteobacterium symbiont of Bathyaustriella thionipta]MCU7956239.1 protein-glutamate O-methyltransferase CheR [gamma proteobacterium symbiont of Bathyaustriella thionipta]
MNKLASFELSLNIFEKLRQLIHKKAGISMSDAKRSLVAGRLRKRLVALNLDGYDDYFHYLKKDELAGTGEMQRFIDLLTTNETWFFREEKHFKFLKKQTKDCPVSQTVNVWSAASSSGEEPYSIAMTLADSMGLSSPWQILGTDISTEILTTARKGIYMKSKIKGLSTPLKRKYMLNGVRTDEDYLAIVPELKKKLQFKHFNSAKTGEPKYFDKLTAKNNFL